MLADFSTLEKNVKSMKGIAVAVAAAGDTHTIEAIKELREHVDARCYLVGDSAKIGEECEKLSMDSRNIEIISGDDEIDAAKKAVALCRDGKAGILMKGLMQTSNLLKAVLDKENGIRKGGLMSHLAVLESPSYHKLMFITDGGMNPFPDFSQKQAILENTVDFMKKLGYGCPNIAALAAVETVSEKMPETVDAAKLTQMSADGEITGCIIEGPLSFDLAISRESADIKGADIKIAGETDVFLVPNISTGNIMTKALMYLGGAKMAGCVLGAQVPIVLTSRGATAEEKLFSFFLCQLGSV